MDGTDKFVNQMGYQHTTAYDVLFNVQDVAPSQIAPDPDSNPTRGGSKMSDNKTVQLVLKWSETGNRMEFTCARGSYFSIKPGADGVSLNASITAFSLSQADLKLALAPDGGDGRVTLWLT